jgi:hypothetical protein
MLGRGERKVGITRLEMNKLEGAKSRTAHLDSMGLMLQKRASRKGQGTEKSI